MRFVDASRMRLSLPRQAVECWERERSQVLARGLLLAERLSVATSKRRGVAIISVA